MLEYAPTGKCPSLHDGKISVWESLAIIEYVAELYPDKAIWPKGKAARAHARSLASEMHAGFQALRRSLSDQLPPRAEGDPAQRRRQGRRRPDRGRLGAARGRRSARRVRSSTAASPPPTRCSPRSSTASTPTPCRFEPATRAYMDAVMALPAWKAWIADGEAEPWRIEKYEAV